MIDAVAVVVVVGIEAKVEAIRSDGNDTAVSARKTERSAIEGERVTKDITSGLERKVSIITATREETANGRDNFKPKLIKGNSIKNLY